MTKSIARILLVIMILAIAAVACVGGGSGIVNPGSGSSQTKSALEAPAYAATATFGAEQFFLQLTAVSKTGHP